MTQNWSETLKKIDETQWEIPRTGEMRVPGRVFASASLMNDIFRDQALAQVANVAQLPGIVDASMAMPDIHWGYGFPIGGVAGFDVEDGIVSPGGVGYDINCGVRLLLSRLQAEDLHGKLPELVAALYAQVPSGVGQEGPIRLNERDLRQVLHKGAAWMVQAGYGWDSDTAHTEDQGCLPVNRPDCVSARALERGSRQLGTLGSGNHFLEVQVVDAVYDDAAARCFGLESGQVTVMIHSGSRGLGYQVCEDYIRRLRDASRRHAIRLPDAQLAAAPVGSEAGQEYLSAMAAAANFAWANRQCIAHGVRTAFEKVFRQSAAKLGLHLLYDVAHNIAKLEKHAVHGRLRTLCVHRKGATRAFPKGHADVPKDYRPVGQPVLIPGSMGTASYVCVGTERAMQAAWGSTAHGAGRVLSRSEALRRTRGRSLAEELQHHGVQVMAKSRATLGEEAPEAYKAIDEVVETVHRAGLSYKVARLRPVGVVKG